MFKAEDPNWILCCPALLPKTETWQGPDVVANCDYFKESCICAMMRLRDVARGGDGLRYLYFYYCHTNHYYYFREMRPLGGTASLQV